MATISIVIPDGQLARVVDGICAFHGYQATIDVAGTPNPESKGQFAKRMVAATVKDWLRGVEGQAAAAVAKQTAIDSVNTIAIT